MGKRARRRVIRPQRAATPRHTVAGERRRPAASSTAETAALRSALIEGFIPDTTPSGEKPALSDAERDKRLASLAERLRSRDGLDHDTLAQIEQLTGDDQLS